MNLLFLISSLLGTLPTLALPEKNLSFCGGDDSARGKRYAISHSGHENNKLISYKITTYSKNLTHDEVDDVLKRAFDLWTQFADLKFIKKDASQPVDIDVGFYVKDHSGCTPFDGSGRDTPEGFRNVVAHASKPFVHFDDEETWKATNEGIGTSLYRVAVHEIGHSLGLSHSKEEGAVMFASHWNNDEDKFTLHADDITGIEVIYGEKVNRPPFNEDLCEDPTFDTMFDTTDGKTYIFKKDKYYELDGVRTSEGPKLIADKWKGLPESMNGAFTQNNKTFFFKNGEYWRFTGNIMDAGYPKKLINDYREIPENFNDVTVWEDGKVYFFAKALVFTTDVFEEPHKIIKPKLIFGEFKGIPKRPDVVHYYKRYRSTFFFKADSFYPYHGGKVPVGFSKLKTNTYFFGCNSHS